MKYIINLEPKVVKNPLDNREYCHVISKKDAVVTKIYSSSGIELRETNDSVKKGDILITGDIKKDEEIKGHVCAMGTVYGTTWYTINIELPKYYEKKTLKDNKKYNILLKYQNKSRTIFKSQLTEYEPKDTKIVSIFGFEIYLRKETEIEITKSIYTEEELENKINDLIEEKMKSNLGDNSRIQEKKVLKKVDKDSKIYLEVFIVAEEEISENIEATIIQEE